MMGYNNKNHHKLKNIMRSKEVLTPYLPYYMITAGWYISYFPIVAITDVRVKLRVGSQGDF